MSKSVQKRTDSPSSDQTRILLSLWELQESSQPVKRSQVNKWVVRSSEKARDYFPIYEGLVTENAIEQSTVKRSVHFTLTPEGLQRLQAGLQDPDFAFQGTIVGTKFANALLHFCREFSATSAAAAPSAPATSAPQLETYEAFKAAIDSHYDTLNLRHDFQDLVPIYRLRRELSEQVEHKQFNEWLIQMQADDLILLMEGETPDMTPDKYEDSITLPSNAFRYYVKRL